MSFLDGLVGGAGGATRGRSIVAPMAVGAVLLVALLAGYLVYFNHPYRVAFGGLRGVDASNVVATLDKKKIPYRLKDGGGTILVPDNLVDAAKLDVVDDDPATRGAVGFELFNKSDMGSTEFAQRINYQRALQGELARTIMSLDWVEAARVHLSLPEATIFRDDRRPPKASVTILPRPGKDLSSGAVDGVKKLVAAAVPDLEAKDVVILDEHGIASIGPDPVAAHPASAGAQEFAGVEQYYLGRIRQDLSQAFPKSTFSLTVSAQVPGDDPAAIKDWSPRNRRFPLVVKIFAKDHASPSDRDILHRLIVKAVEGSASAIDQIVFVDAPPEDNAVAATFGPAIFLSPRTPSSVSGSRLDLGAGPKAFWLILGLAVLAPLGGAGVVLASRRWRSKAPLSAERREGYVDRLKKLLREVDADAPSRP